MSYINKRATLGPLSAGQLNSRPSLGAARLNKPAANKRMTMMAPPSKRSSMAPRQSLAPRRSSGYGGGTTNYPSGRIQDPRPVSEKPYIQQSIRTLIRYLTQHGYDRHISMKLLTAPSSKDFVHLLTFLCRKIDPNFQLGAKFEDEVPLIFKRLKYPFTIAKGKLAAVGSPHSWPYALAALLWLVELLMYAEEADSASSGMDEKDGEAVFYDYLGSAYEHFLAGEDNYENLEAELAEMFDAKNAQVEQSIEQLNEENATLQAEIDQFRNTESPLVSFTKQKKDLSEDVEKFNKLIANLKQHKAALEKKLAERKEEVDAKAQELSEARAEQKHLIETIDKQEISAADVEHMNSERTVLEEALATVNAQKEEGEQKIWNQEIEISKKLEEVEKNAHAYNTAAGRLQLIPSTAKYAQGRSFELEVNHHADTADSMVNVDLRNTVKPALIDLREKFIAKISTNRELRLQAQKSCDESEEAYAEKADIIARLEGKLKKLETQVQNEKDNGEERIRQVLQETEQIEEGVRECKQENASNITRSQQTMQQLTREYEEVVRQCDSEKEELNDLLLITLDLLTSHKATVQDMVHQAYKKSTELFQEIKMT